VKYEGEGNVSIAARVALLMRWRLRLPCRIVSASRPPVLIHYVTVYSPLAAKTDHRDAAQTDRISCPEAHEIIYHDTLWYGPPDSGYPIFYITVFQAHMDLGFFYGGFVPDPERLLVGSGKRMRHIKIRSVQETETPVIASLLAQAWADGVQRVEQLPHRRT